STDGETSRCLARSLLHVREARLRSHPELKASGPGRAVGVTAVRSAVRDPGGLAIRWPAGDVVGRLQVEEVENPVHRVVHELADRLRAQVEGGHRRRDDGAD